MSASRLPIDEVKVGARFRRDLGDLDALAASIADVGLLHPIVVTPAGELIAGLRRLEACRRLGWTHVPVTVVDLEEIVRGEYVENACRKDFTPSEMVAIARALEPLEREAARRRELAGPRARALAASRGSAGEQSSAKLAEDCTGETRDRLAAYVGVGHTTLEKARQVVEAAERDPERFGALVEQMDRTGQVHNAYKRLRVALAAEELEREPPPPPTGPFRVIVVDPPWPYCEGEAIPGTRGAPPYPTMSVEEIAALRIADLAAEDATLWLWTTNGHMHDAFHVVEAWGFQQKTILTWAKDRIILGGWLRGQTEHCLLATRGRPLVQLTNQSTLIHGPVREHSRKPDEFYELVESLCPGSKVELFARTRRPGWEVFGNEVDRFRG